MKPIFTIKIFTIILSALPIIATANMPVIDVTAIANLVKNLQQLKKQYSMLDQTYKNAKQQLSMAQQIANDSEGHYGFGSLDNSQKDFSQREWSPASWSDALHGLSGGNNARYQQLLNEYKQNHPALTQAEFQKGASKIQAQQYMQQVKTNQAVAVNTTYEFNNIKHHLELVHDLSNKIEQAKNTKAAMDLNSRILTEVAYVQIQELKMQSILNQQLVQVGANNIAGETRTATFNQLPKH